jgi:hypothetical protein
MQVKRINALTLAEVRDLAAHTAERGERIKDVNPFARGTLPREVFTRAFVQRAADLRPFAAVRPIQFAEAESTHV